MAKLQEGMILARGSIGAYTFRKTDGGIVVSEKTANRRDRRTRANMQQRTQWANIQAMYRVMREYVLDCFEECDTLRKANNAFMHFNVGRCPVYLPKRLSGTTACVVAPYQVSNGMLKPIFHTISPEGLMNSDIRVGRYISPRTTVADFTRAVMRLNDEYYVGDTITLYVVSQSVGANGQDPEAHCVHFAIRLDSADRRHLSDIEGWDDWITVREGCLGLTPELVGMGATFVHTRRSQGGELRASAQTLVCNNELFATFSSEEAFKTAVDSYGGFTREKHTLTPSFASDKASHYVVIQSEDESLGHVLPHSGRYMNGNSLQLSATPIGGAQFVCWTDLDDNIVSEEPSCLVTVTSGAVYIAHFELRIEN